MYVLSNGIVELWTSNFIMCTVYCDLASDARKCLCFDGGIHIGTL